MGWTEQQRQELFNLAKNSPKAYIRKKALVLWNVSLGRTQKEISYFLMISRSGICKAITQYLNGGAAGLAVKPGRGRKVKANIEEVTSYLRQSPRQFGLTQNRWTLSSLTHTVPSLEGYTEAGVYQILVRLGYRYKRGQPSVHSPDPAYSEKKGLWSMQ